MFAIYKKELKQYFHSMIGFVFLAFFIAIISIYTWANNFYGKAGNFETTLSSSTFLFVLLIPILTMRVLAEEKHQKTDQLLYTAPISIGRVIIGKYLTLPIDLEALWKHRRSACTGIQCSAWIFPSGGSLYCRWYIYFLADREPADRSGRILPGTSDECTDLKYCGSTSF